MSLAALIKDIISVWDVFSQFAVTKFENFGLTFLVSQCLIFWSKEQPKLFKKMGPDGCLLMH